MRPGGAELEVQALVEGVLSGDEVAWRRFLERAWPVVEKQVAGSRSLGPFRRSPDDQHEVVSTVFARLRRDDHRALRLYGGWHDRHPDKTFADWLAIVTANVIRDHVSRRLAAGTAVERLIDTWTSTLEERGGAGAVRPAYTRSATARQLLDRARATLPPDQLAPLESWLRGHAFDEIAELHGLAGGRAAQKKIRAALARLRHHVRE